MSSFQFLEITTLITGEEIEVPSDIELILSSMSLTIFSGVIGSMMGK